MQDWIPTNPVGAGLLGLGAVAVAWKLIIPMLSNFLSTQTASAKAESGTVNQLSQVLKDAIQRAEDERQLRIAAERERDEIFTRFTQLEAQFQIMRAKMEAYERNGTLTAYREDMNHAKNS